MSESYMARLGARLIDNGYPVLPIMPGTKKPGQYKGGAWRDYRGWTKHGNRPTSEHELIIWRGWPDAGIGIPTGTVIGVDINVRDTEVASRLEQLARTALGDTPAVRFGMQARKRRKTMPPPSNRPGLNSTVPLAIAPSPLRTAQPVLWPRSSARIALPVGAPSASRCARSRRN
jgi:hypothetical protein